jgi:hypothetical protein
VIHAPSVPAKPWLTTVAQKMPAMMGNGFLNRAASKKASNWVLSPISARATMPVEISKASTRILKNVGLRGAAGSRENLDID